jgi:hypothetical protein
MLMASVRIADTLASGSLLIHKRKEALSMPKAKYAAEKDSDISLIPALLLLLLAMCLYAFDVSLIEFIVSAIQPAAPPGLLP